MGHADVEDKEKSDVLACTGTAGDAVTIDCRRFFNAFKCCLKQCTTEEHLRC